MTCDIGRCVTCADEGLPLRVLRLGEEAGTVVCQGEDAVSQVVMTDLVGPAGPGDLLLVHAGVALARLDEGAQPEAGVVEA